MTSLVTYAAVVSAVEDDDVAALRQLFNTVPVDINANLDDDIGTALHVAARHNSVRCAETILLHSLSLKGASSRSDVQRLDIDALATEHAQTALMTAAAYGNVRIVRLLVKAGADLNLQTRGCSTALIVACHYGHANCVHALLDRGADPCIVNPWGYTALYMATDTPDLLDRLLTYPRVDVNLACGERGETAVHLAAVIGSVSAMGTLLSAGADINARTVFNENALWLAIWKRHTEVPCMLIRDNIDLDVPSNGCQVYVKHYLPLEVALGLENYTVVGMLLHAGCSLHNPHFQQGSSSPDDEEGSANPPIPEAPWVRLHPEALDYIRANQEQMAWLVSVIRNPASLREICRRLIRRRLGTPLDVMINKLCTVPTALKHYIAMHRM